MKEAYEIDEFVSFTIEEDGNKFKIVLEGPLKYKKLIALKISNIVFTENDLIEFENS